MGDLDTASLLFSLPDGIFVSSVRSTTTELVVHIACRRPSAACPVCQQPAEGVHGYYGRTVADLPCAGRRVIIPARSANVSVTHSRSPVSRANRYARYEAMQALHQQAISEREIARRLNMSRQTVHTFLVSESFPERSRPSYQGSILDRWKAGCWNGSKLYPEVKELGYTGSETLFRLFISSLRKHHRAKGISAKLELSADGAKVSGPVDPASKLCVKRRPSPARASWHYVSQSVKLDQKQRQQIAQIRAAHGDLDVASDLTQAFVSMLAEHRDTDLDSWLAQAEQSGIRERKSFAHGIRRDYAAVRATFTSEWRNGLVESQVNCLKRQKWLMFGRAIFDILRLLVLRRA